MKDGGMIILLIVIRSKVDWGRGFGKVKEVMRPCVTIKNGSAALSLKIAIFIKLKLGE